MLPLKHLKAQVQNYFCQHQLNRFCYSNFNKTFVVFIKMKGKQKWKPLCKYVNRISRKTNQDKRGTIISNTIQIKKLEDDKVKFLKESLPTVYHMLNMLGTLTKLQVEVLFLQKDHLDPLITYPVTPPWFDPHHFW